MPKYVIERTVPSAGQLSADDLRELAAKSTAVLDGMGGGIQWVHSYVAENRLFCVYNAENTDLIREHAARGGFPCDNIRQVTAMIDPVTAEL
jgi:hypothetical protein